MVRLKTRYLLVQIHYPSLLLPKPTQRPHGSSSTHTTLTFHAPSPPALTAQLLLHTLRTTLSARFGDLGAGLAAGPGSLAIKYFSGATSCFVLRCPRAWVRIVAATLCWVTSLPVGAARGAARERGEEVECVMRVLRVSGAIKKCEIELVRRARALCGRVKGLEAVEDSVRGKDGDGMSVMASRGEVEGVDNDEVLSEDSANLALEDIDASDGSDDQDDTDEAL